MAEITEEQVNEKLAKGEALTKEENNFVMSLPPEDAAGNKPADEEGEIDWGKAEDLDKGKEKTAESPEEKKAREDKEVADKATADKKKQELTERAKKAGLAEDAKEEDIAVAEKKVAEGDTTIDMAKLERELAKPAHEANLTDFSSREKAYFHQMQRDRGARQKAEEERDAALFREIKRKHEEEGKPKEGEEEDPLQELKEKDPEDFMTVADVTKILEKVVKKTSEAPKAEEKKTIDPVRMRYIKMCDEETRATHPDDYDTVMELTEELVNTNEKHLAKVAAAIGKGENPAEVTYQLIKADPDFSKLYPAVEIKVKARKEAAKKPEAEKTPEELEKEKKAKEAQDALEKNKNKTKTTGHAGGEGGGSEGDTIDGYSINDIIAMSDMQFAKLSKKTRGKILEQYG